jgi:outer membrane immunogenic protein
VPYNWSGFYVGGSIGGAWTEVERTSVYPAPFQNIYETNGSGGIVGLHAGAQWQWSAWVLGVEAAISTGISPLDGTVGPLGPPFVANLSEYNKFSSLFTVGPRLGYAWDRWMVFVGGGYAQGSIHGEYRVTSTGAPISPAFWGSSRNDGWYVGGGVADVVLGVEYQHFELENKRAFTETPVGGFDDSFDVKARGDIVRARLSVKTQGFGWVR